ncbi:MAG: hypothetical protein WA323_23245 [Candidatus Nitrosopolaris sp.]|jgi:hypothetical protein
MKRSRSHFIGRVRVVFAVTIFIGLVAVMSMSLTTQKISAQTGSLSLSQNTPPAADNKTIQTNINTPVNIRLTVNNNTQAPTVSDIHIQTNMNTPIEIRLIGTDPNPQNFL